MRPDFEPEPTAEEREALEVALARLLQEPVEARSDDSEGQRTSS